LSLERISEVRNLFFEIKLRTQNAERKTQQLSIVACLSLRVSGNTASFPVILSKVNIKFSAEGL
jgi:hypothetical protein